MTADRMGNGGRARRALVTGGAGFIGRRIVAGLASAGWLVTVLDDLSSGSADALPRETPLVEHDVASRDTVAVVERARPDLVIHAAAQVSVVASNVDPERDREVNLLGTEHVLAGARQAGSQRFVFISSGGAVYGDTALGHETDAPAPASFYGVHKLAAEGYVALSGLPFANLRLANVYGPGQRSDLEGGVVAIFVEALRQSRPVTIYGSGEQSRDFVYVDDVVTAVAKAAESDRSGTWNVGTGSATSVRTLLTELEALIGPAAAVKHAAPRSGDVEMSRVAIERISRDLGWTPSHSLRDGLARTLGDGVVD